MELVIYQSGDGIFIDIKKELRVIFLSYFQDIMIKNNYEKVFITLSKVTCYTYSNSKRFDSDKPPA